MCHDSLSAMTAQSGKAVKMIRHRIFGLSLLVILAACSVEEWKHSPSGDPVLAHREVVEDLREQLEQPEGSIQEMDRLSERLPDD